MPTKTAKKPPVKTAPVRQGPLGSTVVDSPAVAGELVESDERELSNLGALTQITRGEVDSQIATAHAYPRDVKDFLVQLETLATLSVDVAETCFYTLTRAGKKIQGPSVRFAELVCATYGNLRINARTMREDDRYVYAQGVAWDIQKNVAIGFEVRRRITNRDGRRYDDDMIGVTANAAASIALRNAVFRVVPKAFWDHIYEKVKKVAVGDAKTLGERRDKALAYFAGNLGISADRVFAYLGIANLQEFTLEHLEILTGLKTALKEGDTKLDEAFPPEEPETKATPGDTKKDAPPAPQQSKLDALGEQLAKDNEAASPPLSKEESQRLDLELARDQ